MVRKSSRIPHKVHSRRSAELQTKGSGKSTGFLGLPVLSRSASRSVAPPAYPAPSLRAGSVQSERGVPERCGVERGALSAVRWQWSDRGSMGTGLGSGPDDWGIVPSTLNPRKNVGWWCMKLATDTRMCCCYLLLARQKTVPEQLSRWSWCSRFLGGSLLMCHWPSYLHALARRALRHRAPSALPSSHQKPVGSHPQRRCSC